MSLLSETEPVFIMSILSMKYADVTLKHRLDYTFFVVTQFHSTALSGLKLVSVVLNLNTPLPLDSLFHSVSSFVNYSSLVSM